MSNMFTMPDRAAADPAVDGWPDIIAVDAHRKLPTFPTHLFPNALGDMAKGAAAEIQAPTDIAGMLVIPIGSSTLAGKIQFSGRIGHNEHAMTWTWSTSPSAERKTPVFNLLRAPLVELECIHNEEKRQLAQLNEIRIEVVENEIKKLKKSATAANMDTQRAEFERLITQRDELTAERPAPCAWFTSPTPEGLHAVLADNGGRVAVFTDEGGLVGVLAGRYSAKGGADLDPFLSGYVGGPLKAPRASRERRDVPNAFLTIGMSVQPSVLMDLAEIGGAEDKGLIGRFLFAVPQSLVGTRMYDESTPLDPAVARRYAAKLSAWASWPGNADGTMARVGLDEQARRAYAKFHDDIERRLDPRSDNADLSEIPSWGGKIAGTTLRIAGLMHCFSYEVPEALRRDIDEKTLMSATEFTNDYLVPHALATFDDMENAKARLVENRVLTWLANNRQLNEFRFRDCFQALKAKRGTVKHVDDLKPAIEQLQAEHYLHEVDVEGERADSHTYQVNPQWDRTQI